MMSRAGWLYICNECFETLCVLPLSSLYTLLSEETREDVIIGSGEERLDCGKPSTDRAVF